MLKIGTLLLIGLTVGLIAPGVQAARSINDQNENNSSKHNKKYIYDDISNTGSTFPRSNLQLGSMTADGGSPGYIVGRTYRDDQAHLNPNRMIGSGAGPLIHFVYGGQACGGENNPNACARWLHYNMFDPEISPGGIFISGANGIPIQYNPLVEGGIYPQMDVSSDDHMVAAGVMIDAPQAEDATRWTKIFWDISPTSTWGTFVGDTLPGETVAYSLNPKYPQIALQEFNGQFYTHVVALGDAGGAGDTRQIVYYHNVNSVFSPGGTWTSLIIADLVWSDSYSLAADHYGTHVAIVWTQFRDGTRAEDIGSHLYVMESFDNGFTWLTAADIINFDLWEDSWQPWLECNALIDTDDYLHVVWNASKYSADLQSANAINPARVYHWTNRVVGPDAGGTTSLIHHHDVDLDAMCGRFFYHDLTLGRPVISQCNDRLYVIWKQAGDSQTGDSTDCADADLIGYNGGYNADILLSVSLSNDGLLWDRSRNLTNSKTSGCDGTDEMPCDHDVSASMSRTGFEAAARGITYWGAAQEVFEVRDNLDPGWPDDDFYIDVQYVNDLFPGTARYSELPMWTNNPIKWFRLPCLPPVIEPKLYIAHEPITHPNYWVKSGMEMVLNVVIENHGNTDLNVTNVSASYIQGPGGWLDISPTNLVVPAGFSERIYLTLNPGGSINPSPGSAVAIEGYVIFESDDPTAPIDSLYVNTVVADTVVQVVWDTITTDYGYGLILSNHGNGGMSGSGGVNLDFVNSGEECTALDENVYTEDVYMSSSTPLVMQSASNYSWNPHYSASDSKPYNFQPVANAVPSDNRSNEFRSGSFVTSDSAIGLVKTTVLPPDGFTNPGTGFVIEQLMVYSADGGTHNGVRLGAWIDWDVPSDIGANNVGGVDVTDEYAWMRGQETDPGADCQDSDRRYAASGLLGYYTTSEYAGDPNVNHTGIDGAYVHLDDDVFEDGSNILIEDSVWEWLNRGAFTANNTANGDKQIMLSYGGFDITPGDTLIIYTFHATMYDGDLTDLENLVDEAKTWYMNNRDNFCCEQWWTCGNVDADINDKVNLADIVKLIDHLFISQAPLPFPEAADIDQCNGVDVVDLFLLLDEVDPAKTACGLSYDCAPSMPDDVIRLEVAHRPNIGFEDYSLQLDLYGRSTVPLRGATAGFTWDIPKLNFDSSTVTFEAETMFPWQLSLGGDDSGRGLSFLGLSDGSAPPQTNDEYVLWGSYYFTVENWQAGDSVRFDLRLSNDMSKLRFITTLEDGRDFVGYTPRWDGPVVVRDAGDYGDLDGSGGIDIVDVMNLIDYLFLGDTLSGSSDLGNVDMCDGTDIADVHYLIDRVFEGAPPLSEAPCDAYVPGDNVGVRFTTTPGAGGGNGKALAEQKLELQLLVANTNAVLGATMGFEWSTRNPNNPGGISHLNLRLDSAKGTALTITGFDAGLEFYESGNLATSNANSHFQFAGSAGPGSPGVAGNTDDRLWAMYFFTLNGWEEGDEILIDTTEYSDGTTFKMASGGSGGHTAGWDPEIIFDCCGSYTSGQTGNVNWEDPLIPFRCDPAGIRNLLDITVLIDHVYISKQPLCCRADGNTNGDVEAKINLGDIQRLIDHVYISKEETEPCL